MSRHQTSLAKCPQNLRVALVCDWLTTPGGAEKVLLELHKLYPQAPIYTSQYSKKGISWFNDATVKTGWLQIFPAGLRKFLGPLRQLYFSHLDLSEYDLVISVTGAEAKAVRARRHLCYCHVPTQYYWQMYDQYLENPGFGILNPLVKFFFKLLVKPLRQADYRAAQRPDQFVTISTYAQTQIKQYYGREAKIIAPPVEIKKFSTGNGHKSTSSPQGMDELSTGNPQRFHQKQQKIHSFSTENTKKSTTFPQEQEDISTESQEFSTSFPQWEYEKDNPGQEPKLIAPWPPRYYIIACRQVNWKRVDLAVMACKQLNLPLLVVGDGPEHAKLLELAGEAKNIRFLPWANTSELAQYLQNAKGYIFPSLEPFGIAAVEALAAGCPVLALAEGGSRDFVHPGENGLLFAEQTSESLAKALQKFEKMSFDRTKVAQTAKKFSTQHFDQEICALIAQKSREVSAGSTHKAKESSAKITQNSKDTKKS